MTRALLALLLTLARFSVDAAPRTRAVRHPAPVTAPAAIVTAARQAAEASMAAGVPAVQIAVSHRGLVIYSDAFGETDRESATAASPRSVLQVGSVTKQFTAAAILRLAERGALTLDDRIEKFVPAFNPRGATITLRQLLSHTSGVRREWFPSGPPWLDLTAPVTRQQTITGLNSGQLLDSPPGTKWSYSNGGYMLLGLARSRAGPTPTSSIMNSRCRSGSSTPACAARPTCPCLKVMAHPWGRGYACRHSTPRSSGRPAGFAPPHPISLAGRTSSQPARSCCLPRTRR